jgi:hypothetical protein
MCLQAAHRHCLTLKEPWKLQASSSSDRPRIGPGSVSREFRLGRDEGRSPYDEPRTLIVGGLWRRIHRRERRRPGVRLRKKHHASLSHRPNDKLPIACIWSRSSINMVLRVYGCECKS